VNFVFQTNGSLIVWAALGHILQPVEP